MTKGQQLQAAAVREAEMQDRAVARYEAELRRIWRLVTRSIRQQLDDWDTDDTGRLRTSAVNLSRAIALRRQIRDVMTEAGLDEASLTAVTDPLDQLAESVLKTARIANPAVRVPTSAREAIEAWKTLRLAELLDVAEGAARAIQRAALDGVLGLRPVEKLVLDVADVLDLSTKQARTVYDTAVSVFSRHMEQIAADGEPEELFLYAGPADDKTRPFCRRWVGKVLERKQIDALDNGQLPDVFATAGGYACRHLWKRVSILDDELRELARTGKRAPWVTDQLAQVAA